MFRIFGVLLLQFAVALGSELMSLQQMNYYRTLTMRVHGLVDRVPGFRDNAQLKNCAVDASTPYKIP